MSIKCLYHKSHFHGDAGICDNIGLIANNFLKLPERQSVFPVVTTGHTNLNPTPFQMILLKGLVLMLFLSGCGAYNDHLIKVTGQIESDSSHAGSRTGGRVIEVLVREGDYVEVGDVLLLLEDDEVRAVVAAAEAKLKQAEALLDKLTTGATEEQLAQAESALRAAEERLRMVERGARAEELRAAIAATDGAKAQLDVARSDYERLLRLYEQDVVPRRQFDQAKATWEAADAQFKSAREQQELVQLGAREEEIAMVRADRDKAQAFFNELQRGTRTEDLAAATAARDAAKAEMNRAAVALQETRITAPISGIVESLDLRPGDLMRPGPAVRIVDPEHLELKVFVSAALLGHVRVGQVVDFTTDSHGTELFHAVIQRIATEGEYTPRNLQTQEERVQQVFEITLELDSAGGRLRPGMAATVLLERN